MSSINLLSALKNFGLDANEWNGRAGAELAVFTHKDDSNFRLMGRIKNGQIVGLELISL